MSDNPFQSPIQTKPNEAVPNTTKPELRPVVEILTKTRPWARFGSIILFIGAAFLGLVSVFMLFVGSAEPTFIGLAFTYAVMVLLYIVPGVYLWQFASRITEFERTPQIQLLVKALEPNKSFWKFVGITTIVVFVIYVGILFFAFAIAMTNV